MNVGKPENNLKVAIIEKGISSRINAKIRKDPIKLTSIVDKLMDFPVKNTRVCPINSTVLHFLRSYSSLNITIFKVRKAQQLEIHPEFNQKNTPKGQHETTQPCGNSGHAFAQTI